MPSRSRPTTTRFLPKGLTVLHEDPDLVVIDKPHGLLTMGTEKEKERTAFYAMNDYVRRGDPRSRKRVFLVHRLDRETSGVLVLAKSEQAKQTLKDHWREVRKTYLAVVRGHMAEPAGRFESYLTEGKTYSVRSTPIRELGRLSITEYRVLKETPAFSLLEVTILTGQKHQIRVHMAESGHPIVGDPRYGPPDKIYKRLALHAWRIALRHPFRGRPCFFEAPAPHYIRTLVGEWQAPDPPAPESAALGTAR